MDKKEVIAYKFISFINRLFKENIFTNINYKLCFKEIILNHETTFMDIFYDDIINLVLLISDIDFITLEKYFYASYNSKLTKENVIRHLDVCTFFLKPIFGLFLWCETKEGFKYWSKKNFEYKEMIERFCLNGESY